MKSTFTLLAARTLALAAFCLSTHRIEAAYGTINNDAWKTTTNGETVYAQYASVSKFGNTYYIYGVKWQGAVDYRENGTVSSDRTVLAINCYTTTDFINFSPAINCYPTAGTINNGGRLGGVFQNSSGEYIMWSKYSGPLGTGALCSTSNSPTGPFVPDHVQTSISGVYNNVPGDNKIFVDVDHGGTPYFITSDAHGRQRAYVCTFSADGKTINPASQIALWPEGQEANHMFYSPVGNRYYYLTSETNGWSFSHAFEAHSSSPTSGFSSGATVSGTTSTDSYWSQVLQTVPITGSSGTVYMEICDRFGNFTSNYQNAGHGTGFNVWVPLTLTSNSIAFNALGTWQLDAAAGTWQSGGGGGSSPTYLGTGSASYNTGAATPGLPSGLQTNDILLLYVETANQAASVSNQNGGTWTEVSNTTQGTGTAGASDATRITVFWSRYNGTQGAPTVADSGDHTTARIIAIRGAVTSGNPWNVTAGAVDTWVDTGGTIPSATTTVANTLVVAASFGALPDANSTSNITSYTNANLSGLTERIDNSTSQGNGGSIGIATGVKATAGAIGTTAALHATATKKAMATIAIRP